MFELVITENERQILENLIETCLMELKGEIVRTESHDYREDLKHQREALLLLQQRLKAVATQPSPV